MYNLELLSKTKHKETTYKDSLSLFENVTVFTVGLKEIPKLASILPIVISGGEEQRFVVVTGIKKNYFTLNRCKDLYIPASIKTYPFVMVDAINEENNQKVRAIAIDKDAFGGEHKIYEEDGKFTPYTNQKIELLKKFDLDVLQSKALIEDLKKWDVLEKSNLDIDINGTKKRVMSDFYMVNREKLMKLDDEILLKLAKSGVLSILDAQINSISNIKNILK